MNLTNNMMVLGISVIIGIILIIIAIMVAKRIIMMIVSLLVVIIFGGIVYGAVQHHVKTPAQMINYVEHDLPQTFQDLPQSVINDVSKVWPSPNK